MNSLQHQLPLPVQQSRRLHSACIHRDVLWLRFTGRGLDRAPDIHSARAADGIHALSGHPIPRLPSVSQWGAPQQALSMHLLVVYCSDKSCRKPHTTVRCYENTNVLFPTQPTGELVKTLQGPRKPIHATYVALLPGIPSPVISLKVPLSNFLTTTVRHKSSHYWLGQRGAWWMHCGLDRSEVHHPLIFSTQCIPQSYLHLQPNISQTNCRSGIPALGHRRARSRRSWWLTTLNLLGLKLHVVHK